jgi:hypothetical protein
MRPTNQSVGPSGFARVASKIGNDMDMSEAQTELCGKCGAEIDSTRGADFTLKDGTRVCDSCFAKETPRPTQNGERLVELKLHFR